MQFPLPFAPVGLLSPIRFAIARSWPQLIRRERQPMFWTVITRFFHFSPGFFPIPVCTHSAGRTASQPASKQASAPRDFRRQASQKASKQGRQEASKEASQPVSQQASEPAMFFPFDCYFQKFATYCQQAFHLHSNNIRY